MDAEIEVANEPRPVMKEITEQEYERGFISNQETERAATITITANDVEGETHIQEVINFNSSVALNEVSNRARATTMEKEGSNESQEMVEMVEHNHTAITGLSDRESLEIVAINMDGQETRITWRGIIIPE